MRWTAAWERALFLLAEAIVSEIAAPGRDIDNAKGKIKCHEFTLAGFY
ncbi:MAG: hypothetical protein ACM34K_06830 [Bacillota bacterium]